MNTPKFLVRRAPALLAGAGLIAVLAGTAQAATNTAPAPGTHALKDGTTLYVADNGRMRMFTAEGQRLHMKDGVTMETRDGKTFVMKEDLNWKQLRQFGSLNPSPR